MGRSKGPGKKDKFEDLDDEFMSFIENASDEDVKKKASEVALSEVLNQINKKADQDLEEKVAQAKMAGEQYAETSKQNKLRLSYAYHMLESRGKA